MNQSTKVAWVALSLLACAPAESLRPEPADQGQRAPEHTHRSPPPVAAGADASEAYQLSYAAEAAGKLDEAISALGKLPAPQRESYLAHYRRGWLLYCQGRFAEAVSAYSKASALEPGSVEARVAVLLPLLAQKRWDDTANAAQEVLKRDPENYLATLRLAFAKFSAKRFAEAEVSYRKLRVLYPADLEVRTGLAWTALRLGQQREALAMFSEVLEKSHRATRAPPPASPRLARPRRSGKGRMLCRASRLSAWAWAALWLTFGCSFVNPRAQDELACRHYARETCARLSSCSPWVIEQTYQTRPRLQGGPDRPLRGLARTAGCALECSRRVRLRRHDGARDV